MGLAAFNPAPYTVFQSTYREFNFRCVPQKKLFDLWKDIVSMKLRIFSGVRQKAVDPFPTVRHVVPLSNKTSIRRVECFQSSRYSSSRYGATSEVHFQCPAQAVFLVSCRLCCFAFADFICFNCVFCLNTCSISQCSQKNARI